VAAAKPLIRRSIHVMNLRDEYGLVRIAEAHLVDRNRPFAGRRALGRFEDETGAVSNGYCFLISRDRILDWLQRDAKAVSESRRAFESVNLHVERNELRLEQSSEGS